jgi:hypothetical protein
MALASSGMRGAPSVAWPEKALARPLGGLA